MKNTSKNIVWLIIFSLIIQGMFTHAWLVFSQPDYKIIIAISISFLIINSGIMVLLSILIGKISQKRLMVAKSELVKELSEHKFENMGEVISGVIK